VRARAFDPTLLVTRAPVNRPPSAAAEEKSVSTPSPVDLRSDTVTRPTPAMREALASAVVGDDVFDDDPTVHALQERVAALCGKERALFVPSGTMGNQLAIRSLTSPGDEVFLEGESHIFYYEAGAASALAGVQLHPLAGTRGELDPATLAAAVRSDELHVPPNRLLCLENTHNRAGGTIFPLEHLKRAAAAARERGLAVHLDGARLWNAPVATGVPLARWADPFDTVMMCFSKGLGAPVGSILVGDEDVIVRARRGRKMYGGGMRQAGILAAACLYALDHHVDRLADDHRRARTLGERAARIPGLSVDLAATQTNIVMIRVEDPAWDARSVVQALEGRGVRMSAYGPRLVRAVTHLDVDDLGIERAAGALEALAGALSRPA
jgi:threonine aldolase